MILSAIQIVILLLALAGVAATDTAIDDGSNNDDKERLVTNKNGIGEPSKVLLHASLDSILSHITTLLHSNHHYSGLEISLQEGCTDEPGWIDSDGMACSYYEQRNPDACIAEGHLYPNNGLDANKACCICGGGSTGAPGDICTDRVGWKDSDGLGCGYYGHLNGLNACVAEAHLYPDVDGITAKEACCDCGGGLGHSNSDVDINDPDVECDSIPGWRDGDGYDCLWYALYDGQECGVSGHLYPGEFGLTANQACCVCAERPHASLPPPPPPAQVPAVPWPTVPVDPRCTDVPSWQDSDGYGCSWYTSFGAMECQISGHLYAGTLSLTANEACCVCGGGSTSINPLL